MGETVPDLHEVTFRRGETRILHGIDLRVAGGEHWVLIGPNGAGKSTMLSFASAQVFPTSGTVAILGQRMGRVELAALRRHIGHVNPRHPLRSNLSVREVVLTGLTGTIERPFRWEPGAAELTKADARIAEVGLTSRTHAGWTILSPGERGRALVAGALIADPELLLFDEPTTGLDVAAGEQLLETIDALSLRCSPPKRSAPPSNTRSRSGSPAAGGRRGRSASGRWRCEPRVSRPRWAAASLRGAPPGPRLAA